MDYEQKYKDALERAKKLYKDAVTLQLEQDIKDYEYIFPELAESEDERIRKEIIDFIDTTTIDSDERRNRWFSWLEKQGGIDNCPLECSTNTVMTDSTKNQVKPKFKVGDWVVWQDKCYKVNYNGCGYELVDQNGLSTSLEYGTIDEGAHLWTIEDAKEGDVLASDKSIYIFREENIAEKPIAYCGLKATKCGLKNGLFINGGNACWTNEKCNPATKEQCDLLFAKMKESGHMWDAEKLELKKYKPVEKKEVTGKLKEMLDNIDPVELEETKKEMMEESASTDDTFFDDYRKTDGEYDEVHISEHDQKSVHLQFTAEGRNISDFSISRIDALILANSIILCLTDSEDTGVLRQIIAALKKQKRKERHSPTSIGHYEGVNTPGKKSPFSEKPITVNVDDKPDNPVEAYAKGVEKAKNEMKESMPTDEKVQKLHDHLEMHKQLPKSEPQTVTFIDSGTMQVIDKLNEVIGKLGDIYEVFSKPSIYPYMPIIETRPYYTPPSSVPGMDVWYKTHGVDKVPPVTCETTNGFNKSEDNESKRV